MKATGIVRRIDDLGRVVIPKEIRRTLRIHEGEPMEIFTGRQGEIILKKYSPIEDMGNLAKEYAQTVAQVLGCLVCISDHDLIVAAAGSKHQDYLGKTIAKELEEAMQNRGIIDTVSQKCKPLPVIMGENETPAAQIIHPVLSAGDVIGSVILMTYKEPVTFSETERKLAQIASNFLGKQMEG